MGINVGRVVRQWALRAPERLAVTFAEVSLDYGTLDARARRAAGHFEDAGLVPGDRIALCVPNRVEFLDAFFGALYAGLTVLPIPPMSAPAELAHRVAHAGAKALVQSAETAALAASVHVEARFEAEALAHHGRQSTGPRELTPDALAMILYTSGTTGQAKGATITHASLAVHTAALVHHVLKLSAADLVLACLPLTHSYGIRMTLLAPFYAGARTWLMSRFESEGVRQAGLAGVTWFPGVPTMFHALAQAGTATPLDFPRLRWAMSAGAPLLREVRVRAEGVLGKPVRQGFGLTEATFSTVSDPDDHAGADSVGLPVPGVEVRIVSTHGDVLGPGEAGEVEVRGQNVMAGYLDDAEATRAAFHDDFLRTGDVGLLDDQGRLTVIDRIKDLIIRGGFNVVPAEVENVLVAHPSVREAVVVGLADARYGEEVVAVIVPARGHPFVPDTLAAHCRSQLSRTKLPRRYACLDALPVGASGKILRRKVRELLETGQLATITA